MIVNQRLYDSESGSESNSGSSNVESSTAANTRGGSRSSFSMNDSDTDIPF